MNLGWLSRRMCLFSLDRRAPCAMSVLIDPSRSSDLTYCHYYQYAEYPPRRQCAAPPSPPSQAQSGFAQTILRSPRPAVPSASLSARVTTADAEQTTVAAF